MSINFENRMQLIMIWGASLICLLAGLYLAIDHTVSFFAVHNYLFAPLQDEVVDTATSSYPILLGKKSFFTIFQPFADHRVVLARLQEMFDFSFMQGVQSIQPYRLSILLWLNVILFNVAGIWPNKNLDVSTKILLCGASLILFFAGISINTYSSTMQTTWPYILLFSSLAFIFTAKYCERASWLYIAGVFLAVNLALYTFNIGLVLWPVILLVLVKRGAYRKHWIAWTFAILLTYGLYFSDGWFTASGRGSLSMAIHDPVGVFLYVSRILSMPLISDAPTTASLPTVVIGCSAILFSLLYMVLFLKKKNWSSADTIIFSFLIFSFLTVFAIAMTRFWSTGEGPHVGTRFTTISFVLMTCLLTSTFCFLSKIGEDSLLAKTSLSMFTLVWLIAFFVPVDTTISRWYDLSHENQIVIAEATGIPINANFIAAGGGTLGDLDLSHHVFLNDTEKKYQKGPYSFWPAQYVGHSLTELKFKQIDGKRGELTSSDDFRTKHHPALFMDVTLKNDIQPIDTAWVVLFTNNQGRIIGFAISAPHMQPLWTRLFDHTTPPILWRGAINTALLDGSLDVTGWAASDKDKMLYRLGTLKIKELSI